MVGNDPGTILDATHIGPAYESIAAREKLQCNTLRWALFWITRAAIGDLRRGVGGKAAPMADAAWWHD